VRVKADHADRSVGPFGDRLRHGIRTAWGVLAQDDRNGPCIEGIVDLLLDPLLCCQHRLVGLGVVGVRVEFGIPVVDHLQVLEDIEVEFLDVSRWVAGRLLSHPLGRCGPFSAIHAPHLVAGAGHVLTPDDHDIGPFEIGRCLRGGSAHEGGGVLVEHRDVGPVEYVVLDRLPVRVAHALSPSSRSGSVWLSGRASEIRE